MLRGSSTARTYRRKKGGLRWEVPCGQGHQGHGARGPRWSSTRYRYCRWKPTRQCAHRPNSRRCSRGRASSTLDRRQSLGRWSAPTATPRRTRHRTDRSPKEEQPSETGWAFAPALPPTMEGGAALRMAETLSTAQHSVGTPSRHLSWLPPTRLRSALATQERPLRRL